MVQAPLASGGTDAASSYVDMQNLEGVCFVGNLGTAGSTDDCKLQVWLSTSTSSTGHASTALSITSTASKSDDLIILDCYKPLRRYIKTHLTRSAAVEYGGTNAFQYGPRKSPVVDSTSLAGTPVVVAGAT